MALKVGPLLYRFTQSLSTPAEVPRLTSNHYALAQLPTALPTPVVTLGARAVPSRRGLRQGWAGRGHSLPAVQADHGEKC